MATTGAGKGNYDRSLPIKKKSIPSVNVLFNFSSDNDTMDYLIKNGVLEFPTVCPNCGAGNPDVDLDDALHNSQGIMRWEDKLNHAKVRCAIRPCRHKVNLTKDTFFYGAHIKSHCIMRMGYYFINRHART